jgi:hypothetical protein
MAEKAQEDPVAARTATGRSGVGRRRSGTVSETKECIYVSRIGPMLALKDAGENSCARFASMTPQELLEVAGRGPVPRSQALPLLIAGYFKGLTDKRDEANLLRLLKDAEEAREKAQEAVSFKARWGVTQEEAEAMLREGSF